MPRLEIQPHMVGVYSGPAYMENTEDGPMGVFDCHAYVTTPDGKELVHEVPFRQRYLADRFAERVRAAGVIDPAHWHELPPRISLEERFAMYAQAEGEARMGLRGEDDLYHGILL